MTDAASGSKMSNIYSNINYSLFLFFVFALFVFSPKKDVTINSIFHLLQTTLVKVCQKFVISAKFCSWKECYWHVFEEETWQMRFIFFCLPHLPENLSYIYNLDILFLDSTHATISHFTSEKTRSGYCLTNVTIQSSCMVWCCELNCHGLLPYEIWHQNICVW